MSPARAGVYAVTPRLPLSTLPLESIELNPVVPGRTPGSDVATLAPLTLPSVLSNAINTPLPEPKRNELKKKKKSKDEDEDDE